MPTFLQRYHYAFSLTAAAACWGIATVISKRAVEEIPPLTLLPIQLGVSVAVLAAAAVGRIRVIWTPRLRLLGALGILNPGLSYALSLLGLARITASLSVLLWTLEPLLILILARLVLRDRITSPLALAMGAAFAGVLLMVFQAGPGGDLTGTALTMAGVGACAVYTVACRRLLIDAAALSVVLIQQTVALGFALILLGGATAIGANASNGQVSAAAWISAAASGALYYAIAFWFYLSGLRRIPAATAGAFINLIPVFGIAAAYLLLGERLVPRQGLGAGLVIAAVTTAAVIHPDIGPASRLNGLRPNSRASSRTSSR
jgi:probable blue pigment (indigoidine) exporter